MKFCFIAPYYSEQSNGIRVLYKAAFCFSKYIGNTKLKIYDPKENIILSRPNLNKIPKKYRFLISRKIDYSDKDIYVLPETPAELPLNINKSSPIVRYLLANPFFFNKGTINFDNQFLLSYSNLISSDLPQYFIEAIPKLKIKNKLLKFDKALIYFGKFRLNKNLLKNDDVINKILKKYKSVEIIHRNYPFEHRDYLKKLKLADILISYDPMSSVTHEASLIGLTVVMIDDLNINKSFNIELENIFYLSQIRNIDYFFRNLQCKKIKIKNTLQSMDDHSYVKIETIKIANLILNYFKNNNFLSGKFKSEFDKMRKEAIDNFRDGIVSFNSPFKIFLIIFYYLDNKSYKIFNNKLNLNNSKCKLFLLLIRTLKFNVLKFFTISFYLCMLFFINKRYFLLKFNKFLSQNFNKIRNI